ncbi:MAG: alkaline phosphatase family protein, partial [Streptosporangiaceae bacterium]
MIFQENVSFDHYFATYPVAANPADEPPFHALPHTPSVAGLSGRLLTANPNFSNAGNGADAANPFRLDRSQAATADQSHQYTAEQRAFDAGAMDLFPRFTGRKGPPPIAARDAASPFLTKGLTMGYFDGNTVTALWNYAQHYALEDHFFGTTFGPSTPGALNLISGQTNG